MMSKRSYTIIWDRIALDDFKNILNNLSNQSYQASKIVRKGVLSRLNDIEKNPHIFENDKLNKKSEMSIDISLFFIFLTDYKRCLIALVASSKPGFSSKANMFFL